ncbi:MAG TPA: IS5/IS1182 family transposase [Parvularcula sp.]|nr:IS5/IS1182 family transposase [Parvularcula sp.]HBS33876.1 IS5/IS1182 family transposase [Parvularcula sp.]
MMGEKTGGQGQFFYQFNLDEAVPADHLLRKIDAVLDLSGLRTQLAPFYSHTGRPSIDPELMIRMLLIGYCCGIRSERRLCEEVSLNLAYRWFCRLGLEDKVPDHSAFSRARHGRFRDADLLRSVFESTVKTCMDKGLVGGEGFATDASIIRADANRQNHVDGGDDHDWTGGADAGESSPSRAVREYLKGLDREAAPPKEISLSDPASRLTAAVGRPAFFGWCTNYLIDVKHAVIMDVAATPALRTAEVNAAKAMIDRVEDRFGMKPKRLIGDTAYGTAEMLAWMVDEKNIEPHVPVWDKGEREDGTFSRSDFAFDAASNSYTCPGGKKLVQYRRNYETARVGVDQDGQKRYRASQVDCGACALKQRCCPDQPMRKVSRSVHEAARDVARAINASPDFQQSRRERKKVEMLFAHLKRILKLDRLRLRGPSGAHDEFTLAATAQNLRKLAKLVFPSNLAMAPA